MNMYIMNHGKTIVGHVGHHLLKSTMFTMILPCFWTRIMKVTWYYHVFGPVQKLVKTVVHVPWCYHVFWTRIV